MNTTQTFDQNENSEWIFHSQSESETDQLGRWLSSVLKPSLVVAFDGSLGAGKTKLIQSIVSELGHPVEDVQSPTFTLIREYEQGRIPVSHFDVYRLKDSEEFLDLGGEEYLFGSGVCLIEWASKVDPFLPEDHLKCNIEVISHTARDFRFKATGESAAYILKQLQHLAEE